MLKLTFEMLKWFFNDLFVHFIRNYTALYCSLQL